MLWARSPAGDGIPHPGANHTGNLTSVRVDGSTTREEHAAPGEERCSMQSDTAGTVLLWVEPLA